MKLNNKEITKINLIIAIILSYLDYIIFKNKQLMWSNIVEVRRIIEYMIKKYCSIISFSLLSQIFDLSVTTVINDINEVENQRKIYKDFDFKLQQIENHLEKLLLKLNL